MFKNPDLEVVFNLMQAQMYISAAANLILQSRADFELQSDLLDISIAIAKVSLKVDNDG